LGLKCGKVRRSNGCWRPRGNGIGSSNGRFQPRLAIGYQDLLDRSLIEFRAFCQRLRKAINLRAVQF